MTRIGDQVEFILPVGLRKVLRESNAPGEVRRAAAIVTECWVPNLRYDSSEPPPANPTLISAEQGPDGCSVSLFVLLPGGAASLRNEKLDLLPYFSVDSSIGWHSPREFTEAAPPTPPPQGFKHDPTGQTPWRWTEKKK